MKRVFSIIWKVIAVAMILVGIYLLVQVMGDAESVMAQYEQLTGNSTGATNSMKIVFLREYVQHTGNTDIIFTLGISQAEADIILKDDLEPENPAEPEDDTQTPGEEDSSGNGSGSGSGSGGGGGNNGGSNPTPGAGENSGISYAAIDPTYGLKQNQANFARLMGSSGSTLKGAGCPIFALYNAYLCNNGGAKHLEDIILECKPNLKINANGFLEGDLGRVGEGSDVWNYMAGKYFNPGGVVYNNGGNDGSIHVNDKINQDGKYIIYYSHGNNKINSKHTDCHWVYAERSGGSFKCYNPGKEGNDIGGKPIVKYYKVG